MQTFHDVLDRYAPMIHTVALTGREACLCPEFARMCESVIGRGFGLSVNTNGLLLDPRFSQVLQKTTPHIFVSVDAPPDAPQGPRPTMLDLWNTLSFQRPRSCKFTIITTVSRSTLTSLPELCDWGRNQGVCISIQPIFLKPTDPLFEKESLWLVREEVWDRAIAALQINQHPCYRIVSCWRRIFLERTKVPMPSTCRSLDRFVIVDPSGKRLKCFASFVADTRQDFPKCFGEHCLFCWDHENLANVLDRINSADSTDSIRSSINLVPEEGNISREHEKGAFRSRYV